MASHSIFYDNSRRIDTGRWVVKMETYDYSGALHSLQIAFPKRPTKAERESALALLEDKLQLAVSIANERIQRS